MFTTRKCEVGGDAGKWYTVVVERKGIRRVGYCALACPGHNSSVEALAHHLQYQLDRESDLWLERRAVPRACEICGEPTTLRARLGRDTLFILCRQHQSTTNLQTLAQQRLARQAAAAAP